MTAREYVPVMVERIVDRFHPVEVILFGSLARGEEHGDSDVDLLVVLPDHTNSYDTAVAVRSVVSDLPVDKDIIVTTPEELERRGQMPGTVFRPALREGKTLYHAPNAPAIRVTPEHTPEALHEEAQLWLRYARRDLVDGELLLRGGGSPANACFHAQQCAEKALKAILVWNGLDVPFVHNLVHLRELIPGSWQLPEADWKGLSEVATSPRYPGEVVDPDSVRATKLVRQAREILEAVERQAAQPPA